MRKHQHNSQSGVTMVEMMLSVSLLTIISATMLESLVRFQEAGQAVTQEYTLERRSADVAMRVTKDLGRSGFTMIDGQTFPVIADTGEADNMLNVVNAFDLDLGFQDAEANEGRGDSHELVFCLPDDADGDGWPDTVGSQPAWSPNLITYYLRPSTNGRNDLVREQQNGRLEVLCRGVAQFEVETPEDTGFVIPLDSIRMTLTLASEDGGQQFEKTTQEVIQLRNGGLAP